MDRLISNIIGPALGRGLVFAWATALALADPMLVLYEGDVLPSEASPPWLMDPCDPPCSEAIEDGQYVLRWDQPNEWVIAFYRMTEPPRASPDSLWVEWQFRSNHPKPEHSSDCDAWAIIDYRRIVDLINLYGDAVISFGGDESVLGLEIDRYRTLRFESPDGLFFWFSIDGLVFRSSMGQSTDNGYDAVQFGSFGGCIDDWIPNMENAWDFVRYGTISYGERIVGSNPPAGFIDARVHTALDRFTIRYDSPNYVYIDEIMVDVVGTEAQRHEGTERNTETSKSQKVETGSFDLRYSPFDIPIVVATRRLDNGPPDVVEIALDRPMPYNATTRFTFDDGTLAQSVEFTYAPGDADGDGRATLSDFAYFQNCFETEGQLGPCPVFDSDADGTIDVADFAEFQNHFTASDP